MIGELNIYFDFREKVYDTFSEAIDAQKYSIRTQRSRKDTATTLATHILDYRILIDTVQLLLSDRRILSIECHNDIIDWQLVDEEILSEIPRRYMDEVKLNMKEPKEQTIIWRPDETLRMRINKQGIAIAASETELSLSVRGYPELLFSQMFDDKNTRMLFFHEE
jgi:hypothetical protein